MKSESRRILEVERDNMPRIGSRTYYNRRRGNPFGGTIKRLVEAVLGVVIMLLAIPLAVQLFRMF